MQLKILWVILVIAQFALGAVFIFDIPGISLADGTSVILVAMPVMFVSVIFLVFVRKYVERGKKLNNFMLIIAYITSLLVVRFLGIDILGLVVFLFGPLLYIASVIFSVVYGIKIFKPTR